MPTQSDNIVLGKIKSELNIETGMIYSVYALFRAAKTKASLGSLKITAPEVDVCISFT